MISEEDIKNFENKNLLDSTVLELEWVLTKTASISGLNNIQKTQNKNYRIAIYCLNKQREEKDKEIERLNNIITKLELYLINERINNWKVDEWTIMEIQKELEKLKEGK